MRSGLEIAPEMLHFAANMKAMRKRQGLTLKYLSSFTTVSKTTLNQIELGRRKASTSLMSAIATALGADLNSMLLPPSNATLEQVTPVIYKEGRMNIRNYLHQSNLLEGFDSQEADDAAYSAWRYLADIAWHRNSPNSKKHLTHKAIQEIQARITAHQLELQWRGAYRDRGNIHATVNGKQMPAPGLVPALMDNWLLDFDKRTPRENHIAFEKIHPFEDGNGRVGRMLMWYQENYINKTALTMITPENKEAYYKWFDD